MRWLVPPILFMCFVAGCTPSRFREAPAADVTADAKSYTVRLTGKSPDWVAYVCLDEIGFTKDDAAVQYGAIIAAQKQAAGTCPVDVIDTLRPNALVACFEVMLACHR